MKRYLILAAATLLSLSQGTHAQGGTTVTATPGSLTFVWQIGAKLPAAQTLSVRYGSLTPAYTIATPGADLWLIATQTNSALPGTISVEVDPYTLSPGTYTSSVTVTVTGVASPLVVPVTLTVSESGTSPAVAPTAVPLSSPGTLSGTFTISSGPLPTTFTATPSVAWLTVNEATGALLPAQSQTLTITANPALLNPSATAYAGRITVVMTSDGVATTQTVTVNFTVNPLAPTLSSVWPSNIPIGSGNTIVTIRGANFYSGTTVTATGQAANLATTLVSSSALLATIPATLLTSASVLDLTVTNPAPGGPAVAPAVVTVGNISTITAITNSASYAIGAISPGEIISIFGSNIGPSTPAELSISGGYVQTALSGVSVAIDGQAAPIVYVSASQVSVQVPYNARLGTAAMGTARTFVLTYGTATPASTTVDIVASAPGLFTLNASGVGEALVLNYNSSTGGYSVNSAQNPAAVGQTVVFFLTGEGDYANAVYSPETGFVVPLTPPVSTGVYPELSTLPTVTIGSTAVTNVAYAGPIPGSMLGLLQINAVIPAGVSAGNTIALQVTIGATQTQANVTLAVQ